MKWYKKYFSIHHYIAVLKRQPVHMQHVYAILFAGSITLLLASCLLYFQYGFWREKYTRINVSQDVSDTETVASLQEETPLPQPLVEKVSPLSMLQSFFVEAKGQLKNINTKDSTLLKNKASYTRE